MAAPVRVFADRALEGNTTRKQNKCPSRRSNSPPPRPCLVAIHNFPRRISPRLPPEFCITLIKVRLFHRQACFQSSHRETTSASSFVVLRFAGNHSAAHTTPFAKGPHPFPNRSSSPPDRRGHSFFLSRMYCSEHGTVLLYNLPARRHSLELASS